ncbi:YafY family transcriptional regulator [Rhodobacteraceae bacterium M382]|nr:YafY family transcriptional regulator [Rhodobacteraceae bacterium M382]
MSRSHRLLQLMQCLRDGAGPKTAVSLARELNISARSIHRDIATLREMGAVIDGAAGYGFTLIEDNAIPPLRFTDDELEALVLGLREVQQIGDPDLGLAAGQALTKLQGRLPPRQSHRLKHAVLSAKRFVQPETPGISAARLRKATWDEMEIRFGYTDVHGAVTHRQARPLGIAYMDRSTVLIAWCLLRQDKRVFRLDRMRDLEVTQTCFRPNRVPMLRDAIEQIRCDIEKTGKERNSAN